MVKKNEDLAVRLITMVSINLANTQNNTIMMHLVVVHLNDDSLVKGSSHSAIAAAIFYRHKWVVWDST